MNSRFEKTPELRTDRLCIRAFTLEDKSRVFELRSDPRVFTYLPFAPAKSEAEIPEYIDRMNSQALSGNSFLWGICDIENPKAIFGYISLFNYDHKAAKVEIGYLLMPEFHGKGLMNEAARKVIDFAFHEMKAREILAIIHKDNNASISTVAKLDFLKDTSGNWKIDAEDAVYYHLQNVGYNELPVFKYSPNPLQNEQINRWPDTCDVCKQSRNYFYTGPYKSDHPDSQNGSVERYCVYCLANGELFKLLKGKTIQPENCESVDDEKSLELLTQKSPCYNGWRDEKWPSHCGDFCAFESYFHYDSMKELIEEIKGDWEAAKKEWKLSDEDMSQIRGKESRVRAYLFSCLKCEKKRFLADVC